MDTNKNIQEIPRRFFKGIEEKNIGAIEELWSPKLKLYTGMLQGAAGRDEHLELVNTFITAFPDLRFNIEDTFTDGNKVVTRGTFTGTNKGEFQGMPPTNKRAEMTFIDIMEISNGRIVSEWVEMDVMSLMQQLGVIPQK